MMTFEIEKTTVDEKDLITMRFIPEPLPELPEGSRIAFTEVRMDLADARAFCAILTAKISESSS